MMKIENLIFEGGGPKGVAYGGVLLTMNECDLLSNLKRVGGTSAGAITATLVALNYSPREIIDIISDVDFSAFKDDSFGIFRDMWRLIRYYGWHPGDTIKEWLGDLIAQKLGSKDATFHDLYKQVVKGDRNYKDLYIVCTNLSKQRIDTYSTRCSAYDIPIVDVVRMSMGIPFFFQRCTNREGDIMVDGGLANNYPIRLFDKNMYLPINITNGNNLDEYIVNKRTIGFRLDTKDEINASKDASKISNKSVKIHNVVQFTTAVIRYMMEAANKKHLSKADFDRTVFIDTEDVGSTDFSLSKGQIDMLIRNGSKAVNKYFYV